MQSFKHMHSTTITSEEYLHEQLKNHQGNRRTFLCKVYLESARPPQTVVHKHHQGDISEPKLAFAKQGRKSWEIHAVHDEMDKGKSSRKNCTTQAVQAAHKPCVASTPSKNHKAVRTR